ncbi:MAG: hypothetical protein PCFJNLEI_00906 [Verrucomicrobiae bacterium]|nr:hypothetical protein [Verrucomicrobiae bacterium]
MRRFISNLVLGTAISLLPVVNTSAGESAVTWQSTIIGQDRGIIFLTFVDDLTLTGYGISLNFLGPFTTSGTWGEGAKESVLGGFTSFSDRGNQAGLLEGSVRGNGGFFAKVTTSGGPQKFKAPAPAAIADLSGSWTGSSQLQGKKSLLSFVLTPSTNNLPGWFDLTGTGIGETGSFTLTGAVLMTSDRNAAAYTVSNFGTSTTQAAFIGKVGPKANKWTFKGKDEDNKNILFKAERPKP